MPDLTGFIEVPTVDGTMLIRVGAVTSASPSADGKKTVIKLLGNEPPLETSLTYAQLIALIINSQ